jgi:hypothetical protein
VSKNKHTAAGKMWVQIFPLALRSLDAQSFIPYKTRGKTPFTYSCETQSCGSKKITMGKCGSPKISQKPWRQKGYIKVLPHIVKGGSKNGASFSVGAV